MGGRGGKMVVVEVGVVMTLKAVPSHHRGGALRALAPQPSS